MATSPLHLAIVGCIIPSISRPLHLPDLQQGFLKTFKPPNPLSLAYRREALQMPAPRMRQGIQRSKQHEEARARMSQLRRGCDGMNRHSTLRRRTIKTNTHVLMYKVQYFLSAIRICLVTWGGTLVTDTHPLFLIIKHIYSSIMGEAFGGG